MIVYVKNYKGGVGKSTITKNISHGSSLVNLKTLIITFDTQNNSYRMLTGKNWKGKEGFKKYVTTGIENHLFIRKNLYYYPLETDIFGNNLKEKLILAMENLKKEFDIIYIDGAPAEHNLLDKVGVTVSDKIIVPMIMDAYSLDGLSTFLSTEEASKVSVVIPNLYTGTKIQKAHYEALKNFLYETDIVVVDPIRRVSFEEELSHTGRSIFETEAKKTIETRENYLRIMDVVING